MGSGITSGLTHGMQISFSEEHAQQKAKENEAKLEEQLNIPNISDEASQILIAELEKNKIKFTKEDMLFITKDKSGQIVWLEEGNKKGGLKHILDGHANNICKKLSVSPENLVNTIKDIVTNGEVMCCNIAIKNGRETLEKVYLHKNEYYMLGAVGTNGFIVSIYPIKEKYALNKIERSNNEQ